MQAKIHQVVNTVKEKHIQKALHEPVISIHVNQQQGPNDLFSHAAINSNVPLTTNAHLRCTSKARPLKAKDASSHSWTK
jgi:hypothetical protein